MDLLEHYIKQVHSVDDVTNIFEGVKGYSPNEPVYSVRLTCDCYGIVERRTMHFFKSEWEEAQKKGYFMA